MFALNLDGWTSNLAPMLICVAGLLLGASLTQMDLHFRKEDGLLHCYAAPKAGIAYLVLGLAPFTLLVLLTWSASFDPAIWMVLAMTAPPVIMGAWHFIGSIFGWDMRTRTLRFWYWLMLLHFVLVLALPVIWNS